MLGGGDRRAGESYSAIAVTAATRTVAPWPDAPGPSRCSVGRGAAVRGALGSAAAHGPAPRRGRPRTASAQPLPSWPDILNRWRPSPHRHVTRPRPVPPPPRPSAACGPPYEPPRPAAPPALKKKIPNTKPGIFRPVCAAPGYLSPESPTSAAQPTGRPPSGRLQSRLLCAGSLALADLQECGAETSALTQPLKRRGKKAKEPQSRLPRYGGGVECKRERAAAG